jgi:hypothetical protein
MKLDGRLMSDFEEDRTFEPKEFTGLGILLTLNQQEAGVSLCERCDQFHPGLTVAPVRTMYADGSDPQPLLCPPCTEEWHEHWDYMWAEYNSGRL